MGIILILSVRKSLVVTIKTSYSMLTPVVTQFFQKWEIFKKIEIYREKGIEVQFFADSSVKISLLWETLYIFGNRKLRRIFLYIKINFDFFQKSAFPREGGGPLKNIFLQYCRKFMVDFSETVKLRELFPKIRENLKKLPLKIRENSRELSPKLDRFSRNCLWKLERILSKTEKLRSNFSKA
jgi:hypothetical protein